MSTLVLPAGHGQPPLAVPGVYLKVTGGGEGLSARPLAPTGSFPLTHGSPQFRGCEWPRLARRRTRGCAVTCGCGHGSGPGGLPSLLFVRAISALAHPRGRGGTQGQQQAGPVSQPGFLPLLGTPSGDSVSRFRRRPGRCPNPCT